MINNHDNLSCTRGVQEPSVEEVTAFVRKVITENGGDPDAPFKPVVYYNARLDTVRVLTADCSVTEVPIIMNFLTVYERNHFTEEGQEKIVGFSLECARSFCRSRGLKIKGATRVSDILRFMTIFAGTLRAEVAIKRDLLPLLEKHNIDKFEFPPA